ncbi:M48 family metallopeptidase [Pseudalkalibacillus salsuginis]|uniref:M48 family metallopeptidase n=1 Tax=Pseudalkalibacillus salsuginis TaxID=2910972 RepID=UPI001F373641|nr:M48 family metallopeptidase [Pseudalkalibacillus salsuginis]MCF6409357.1 M48 family metallopeptidase [Pseudalkalibacillus salsuginis]
MINRLVHDKEKGYFIFALVLSVVTYLVLIFSIIGIFYILGGLLITTLLHGLMVGNILNNGVRITSNQYPEVYERTRVLCDQMGLDKVPDVYVMQSDGILNAFATRFFGRNFVVLYSDIFELHLRHNSKELDFIIAHELAHIQRNHIMKQLVILPALWTPFLGNAYSRACEHSCDRIAAVTVRNVEAGIRSLSLLAIGKVLFDDMNVHDYLEQHQKEKGFFVWFSHIMSTHPPLPLRINELQQLYAYPQLYGFDPSHFEKIQTTA